MKKFEIWKNPSYDFKIKSFEDANYFVNDCLIKGHSYFVKVSKDCAISIEKQLNNHIEIGIKQGNLLDVFNPVLIVPDNEMLKTIYKFRKAINAKFFNN